MAKLDFDALNAAIRYLMFSVFAVRPGALGTEEGARDAIVVETSPFLEQREKAHFLHIAEHEWDLARQALNTENNR